MWRKGDVFLCFFVFCLLPPLPPPGVGVGVVVAIVVVVVVVVVVSWGRITTSAMIQ